MRTIYLLLLVFVICGCSTNKYAIRKHYTHKRQMFEQYGSMKKSSEQYFRIYQRQTHDDEVPPLYFIFKKFHKYN